LWRGHTIVDPSPSLQWSLTGEDIKNTFNTPSVLKRGAKMRATVRDSEDLSIQVGGNKDGKTINLNRN
jgi:hypothetical protein